MEQVPDPSSNQNPSTCFVLRTVNTPPLPPRALQGLGVGSDKSLCLVFRRDKILKKSNRGFILSFYWCFRNLLGLIGFKLLLRFTML
jgi:hypothetical protein